MKCQSIFNWDDRTKKSVGVFPRGSAVEIINMKILVTGGSAFIGTNLVTDLLKDGHSLSIYDKKMLNLSTSF